MYAGSQLEMKPVRQTEHDDGGTRSDLDIQTRFTKPPGDGSDIRVSSWKPSSNVTWRCFRSCQCLLILLMRLSMTQQRRQCTAALSPCVGGKSVTAANYTPKKMYPYTHGVRIQQTLQLIHLISSQRRPLRCRRTSHPTHVLMGDATLYLGLRQPQCLVTLEGQRHHDCLLLHLQTHFIISSWEEGLCYDLGCHGNCHQGNGPAGPRWYLRSNPSSLLLRSGRARTVSVPADGLGFKTQNTDKQSCLHKWKNIWQNKTIFDLPWVGAVFGCYIQEVMQGKNIYFYFMTEKWDYNIDSPEFEDVKVNFRSPKV